MKRQELIDRLSPELSGYTIMNIDTVDPFGWDFSADYKPSETRTEENRRETGKTAGNRRHESGKNRGANAAARENAAKKAYDAGQDERLENILNYSKTSPGMRRFRLRILALYIVSGLCRYSISEPEARDMNELFAIAGVTRSEMNVYVNTFPTDYLSCFGTPAVRPLAMLFHRVLVDALCEGCGLTGWTPEADGEPELRKTAEEQQRPAQDKTAGRTKAGGKKTKVIRQYVQKGETAALERLRKFSGYLVEQGLLTLDCLWVGQCPEEEREQKRKKRGQEAVARYDDFVFRNALLHCKTRIGYYEVKKARARSDRESERISMEGHRRMKRIMEQLRREKKSGAAQARNGEWAGMQKKGNPAASVLMNDWFGNPLSDVGKGLARGKGKTGGVGLAESLEPVNMDVLLLGAKMAEAERLLKEGKIREVEAMLKPEISKYPYPPQLEAVQKRMDENYEALNQYNSALVEQLRTVVNGEAVQQKEALEQDDGADLAECAFAAILDGDETYKLNISDMIYDEIGQLLGIPGEMAGVPELSDEDDWDDTFWPGDNGKLALAIVKDPEVILNETRSGEKNKPGLLCAFRLNALIAQYSKCRFSDGIYIRKSIMAAFRELGYSERRARDFAIVIATLQFAKEEGLSGELPCGQMYSTVPDTKSRNPEDGEAQLEAKILTAERDDAVKRRKAAERESQRLRHDVAELQRKQEELEQTILEMKAQLKKRDELIDLYEKTAQNEGEEDSAGEIQFPYHTNLNVVLYGGFHSFHQDVEKLIPGIRIVGPSAHLDMSVFRNADIIFLQINKTDHSSYWSIIDTAKASGVPFHHLNYAGPKRCAQVMVKRIKEIEGS